VLSRLRREEARQSLPSPHPRNTRRAIVAFDNPVSDESVRRDHVIGIHEIGVQRAGDTQLGRDLLGRARTRLRQLIEEGRLAASERVTAGDALSKLGDPRFSPDVWGLPDEDLLGFVEIPAGPFVMGTHRREHVYREHFSVHELELPLYYTARYPVTVGQFRAFVESSGFVPGNRDCEKGIANHPVVNVSWYEALAYCEWLTARLTGTDAVPGTLSALLRTPSAGMKWRVTLPSEAEWEKAARGPSPSQQEYPWGEWQSDTGNFEDTRIGGTSPVGCFPKGRSKPHGILDLGGNVFEWTRSIWGRDFQLPDRTDRYEPGPVAEDFGASSEVLRVVRGGSFSVEGYASRCSSRLWYAPDARRDRVGFRVVVSGFMS
jgi:formylglycine-generating enzyme required for sulfatase activity